MFYEIKGIEKGNVLENTFEKSKNQNPSKKVWDLKKNEILWVGVTAKRQLVLKNRNFKLLKPSFSTFSESVTRGPLARILVKYADA